MGRESGNGRQMRMRIAQLAARIMAEDGIEDFGLAKRKAARQAGAPDTRNLPDNAEVEQALMEYQQLYQAAEQADRLRSLRERARDLLLLFARFDPHLVGSVLSGTAGRYADVDLHLFTDSPKDVELFLLNRSMPFKLRENRFSVGGEVRLVPGYDLDYEGAGVRLSVFGVNDNRSPIRSSSDGRTIERVRLEWLERLLSPDTTSPSA
ncbi:MAG: hypothetical protein GC151_01320 [Betaproteobacteria bacterium]|nr:hypothetical protein [Betaproteobacteria bacterium]